PHGLVRRLLPAHGPPTPRPAPAHDITTTEDGGLLLQKHLPACNICGGTQGVVKFKGFDICRECRQGLREVAGND
ncbi:MAG: hypothetical protein K2P33_11270, partial [Acutalibacter sp.]|nr:hypothetical protein [Acutalibacter sp.]